MKIKIKKKNGLFIILSLVLFLNLISHFMENTLHIGNVYYVSYLCWMLLFFYSLFVLKNRIKKNQMFISVVLPGIFLLGAIAGMRVFEDTITELHLAVFVCMAYMFTMGTKISKTFGTEEVYLLLRLVVILGMLASLYALVFQYQYALLVLKRVNVNWNSWFYKSFFAQRNIFGEYCFLATVAALYNFYVKKNKWYVAFIALMGLQIYITNSRAALIGYFLVVGLSIYFTVKNKFVLTIIVFISIILFASIFNVFDIIAARMSHITSDGTDSGMVRLNMWSDIFNELNEYGGLLFGFGQGTIGGFLYPVYQVRSSHNSYIDYLFSGGIAYISIIVYAILYSFKKIIHNRDKHYRVVFLAAFTAFLVYGMVEAGMSLFCSNYFSVTATLLFVYIPRVYSGNTGTEVYKDI